MTEKNGYGNMNDDNPADYVVQNNEYTGHSDDENKDNYVRESAAYELERVQGEFTIKDYFALPDDDRKELIDGVFYDMASPTYIHQCLCMRIAVELDNHITKKDGNCVTFSAPLDIQLDCDDKTIVQPDVIVICDRDKFYKGRIFGAPDFVIEILSPSTSKKDRTIKLYKYRNAGVREYWMIDPEKKSIVVHYFEKESFARLYNFDAKVPVNIFDGECEIDFPEIYEKMTFLYESL